MFHTEQTFDYIQFLEQNLLLLPSYHVLGPSRLGDVALSCLHIL